MASPPPNPARAYTEFVETAERLLCAAVPEDTIVAATASPDGGSVMLVTRSIGARALAHIARMLLEQASDALGDTPTGREDDILWNDIEAALSHLPAPADDDDDGDTGPGVPA